jgi:hypothetical protein
VNQVVSRHIAKRRQLRWTYEGAHCMAQVKVAVLNGEFSPRRNPVLQIADSNYGKRTRPASVSGRGPRDGTDRAAMPFNMYT